MNKILYFMLFVALTVGLSGCSSEDATSKNDRKTINISRGEMDLVRQNNDFALRLIQAVQDDNSQVVSPLSTTLVLAMLTNGADGETKQEICQTLGFAGYDMTSINGFCKKLITESPALDRTVRLEMANNIFVDRKYTILPDFSNTASTFYGAELEKYDFSDSKTLEAINRWSSEHTNGCIPKVLDRIDADAVSCLVSAVYFKGAWKDKFPKSNTREAQFLGGKKARVKMMQRTGQYEIAENDLLQLLTIPYGNEAFQMNVMLPREGISLDEMLQAVEGGNLDKIMKTATRKTVEVWLPTFETKRQNDLKEVMSKLGMPKAFSEDAEFPGFCDVRTFISIMNQCSMLKVDEEGTEAASATAAVIGETANIDPFRAQFHADHPFIYYISEKSTGTIYFIGSYMGD